MALHERGNEDPGTCHARLFDARGEDRTVACGDIAHLDLQDHRLLWIDLRASDAATCEWIWTALLLPRGACADLRFSALRAASITFPSLISTTA